MTTSELVLSKIALRLAVIVALGLLGHLSDRRDRPSTAPTNAIQTSAIGPQASALEKTTDEIADNTD